MSMRTGVESVACSGKAVKTTLRSAGSSSSTSTVPPQQLQRRNGGGGGGSTLPPPRHAAVLNGPLPHPLPLVPGLSDRSNSISLPPHPKQHPDHHLSLAQMKMAYDLGATPLFAASGGGGPGGGHGGPPGGGGGGPHAPPSLASLWANNGVPTTTALALAGPYGGAGGGANEETRRLFNSIQRNLPLKVGGLSVGLPPHGMPTALPPLYGAPPPQSVLESLAPPPPPKPEQVISGFGKLTWLSSKAGLITCNNNRTISFQIKDFCDNQLTDLTSVLRVGFTLSFQAAMSESNEYIATLVSPLYGAESEKVFANAPEANLDDANTSQHPGNNKDAYCLRIEERAIPTLLAIFQRHAVPQIQLSSLHSQMSSVSGSDDELFRYVGSSSLKRRQFIERRTHIFCLSSDDTITLQQPFIYSCVLRLAAHLLRRGGVTAIESLYEFYMSHNMAPDIRMAIGETRNRFIELMQTHPWIFSIFPNRTYVSVRRNLPHYDYPEFIRTTFAECELFRPSYTQRQMASGYGGGTGGGGRSGPPPGAGGLSRTLSQSAGSGGGAGGGAGGPSGGAQPLASILRHQSVGTPTGNGPVTSRPHSLWPDASDGGNSAAAAAAAAAAQWYAGTGANDWRPQPLMQSLGTGGGPAATPANKAMSNNAATQTETDSLASLFSAAGCVCPCNCGARQVVAASSALGASRTSFSATPPSAPSTSHSPPMTGSPSGALREQIRLPNFDPPRGFGLYDPFGFDLNSPNLSAMNLNL